MKSHNLLTIFIVTYNRENYLKECIESVLKSTYEDFDLYILDNASTDNTKAIINSFQDNRIKYIKHTINIGGIANINYAIKMCETKYFVIFHDDDIMGSMLIERELSEMERHEEYAIISSKSTILFEDRKLLRSIKEIHAGSISRLCYSESEYLVHFLKGKGDGVNCPSVMYRNDFIKKNKLLFEEKVGPAADQYLWFEVERLGGTICCLNEGLMQYRVHEGQDSNINYFTMEVELYRAISNSEYYKSIVSDSILFIEKRFFRLALKIGEKYCSNKITLINYLDYMDIIINQICRSKLMVSKLLIIRFFVIKFPKIYLIMIYLLKKTLYLGRKIKKLWQVVE